MTKPGLPITIKDVTHHWSLALLLLLAGTLCSGPLAAKEQTASINAGVAAGKVHATRLRNLPSGAFVTVTVTTDGAIKVWLLDTEDYRAFPAVKGALLTGSTADNITLGVKIPKSDTYFLLVDNRAGTAERNFTLKVTGSTDAPMANRSAAATRADEQLDKFEENLRRYFVFDDLQFRLARCGMGNAFSTANIVIICAEIWPKLIDVIGDEDKARDALVFAMMHEIGHTLLAQWGYPFSRNEEVADEFATAMLMLFGQGERARAQAEFFSKVSPERELELKRDRDDRHPLSVQRARNILHWLDDKDLLKRWQTIFVPHLQTDILKTLSESVNPWIDHELVAKELASRDA